MDRESTASDLGPERLARLWDIGSDVSAQPGDKDRDSDERYAELLCDWMARQLPPNPAETQELVSLLPGALGQFCRELCPFSGDSIGVLLTDSSMDVQVFGRIKDYAKESGAAAASELEREAALTIYFAAIAGALVFHNTRISQHSDKKLRSAFGALGKRNGLPSELRSLFQKACRGGKHEPGTSP